MDWTAMKMAVKSLLSVLCKCTLLLLITASICSGAEIEIRQPTPVFEKPDVFSASGRTLVPGIYQVHEGQALFDLAAGLRHVPREPLDGF